MADWFLARLTDVKAKRRERMSQETDAGNMYADYICFSGV